MLEIDFNVLPDHVPNPKIKPKSAKDPGHSMSNLQCYIKIDKVFIICGCFIMKTVGIFADWGFMSV